jgi:hypothetical protein
MPITRNSTFDNIRPIMPKWDDPRTVLLWMRGSYVHNHGEWYSSIVALILPPDTAAEDLRPPATNNRQPK